MRYVALSQLKNQLSALIDRVRSGEMLVVMDRDTPVASISPIVKGEHATSNGILLALERLGVIVRSKKNLSKKEIRELAVRPDKPVNAVNVLLEERREGR